MPPQEVYVDSMQDKVSSPAAISDLSNDLEPCTKRRKVSDTCKEASTSSSLAGEHSPVSYVDESVRSTVPDDWSFGQGINVAPSESHSPSIRKRKLCTGSISVRSQGSTTSSAEEESERDQAEEDGEKENEESGDEYDSEPKRKNRRTLYLEYWSRSDECKERKWDHLDKIREQYECAEDHIFATTLNGRTACLEPNMFPYDTPAGIEHWTFWHVDELRHEQIKDYVERWIDTNAPHVIQWNYDDNPERSIAIFHVHVYFQVPEDTSVLQDGDFDDFVHELD